MVLFIVGILLGILLSLVMFAIRHKKIFTPVGCLRVDTSDPDGPYLFLELAEDVNTVCNREYVLLEVNMSNYISQK